MSDNEKIRREIAERLRREEQRKRNEELRRIDEQRRREKGQEGDIKKGIGSDDRPKRG